MASAPLIVIPVRGGSKGVPRKNLRAVGGISLIGRAVRTSLAACRALGGGRVIVDSEDDELRAEGRRWGAETPYARPRELASDTASSLAVLRHALGALGIGADDPRAIALVQATSPLLGVAHLVACLRAFAGDEPVISVASAEHPPAWHFGRDDRDRLKPLYAGWDAPRRQDLPPAWRQTGAVNIASARDVLAGRDFVQPGRTRLVEMAAADAIDIDDEADLARADAACGAAVAPFAIAGRAIGPGHPCFIIAEAGVNHDGDRAEAHRLIDLAADIGADAVKFQTWQTELLCRPGAAKADYQRTTTGDDTDQFAMLKAIELPYAWHAELQAHARERRVVFMSTPDEIESCRFLVGLGVPALKIGSGELDNLPYLAQVAAFGLPTLMSTGMGDLREVARALDTIAAHGAPPIALFHCVSAYPAPLAAMNLRAIGTLARAFGVPVGLSDHYPGVEAVLAAVGAGLPLWEKHLTRDRSRSGPDHQASLGPDEFARQIAMVRAAETALGSGEKVPAPIELGVRDVVRRRLCAARALPRGHVLAAGDLTGLRDQAGLPISDWQVVVGRRLRRAVETLAPISEGDLDG